MLRTSSNDVKPARIIVIITISDSRDGVGRTTGHSISHTTSYIQACVSLSRRHVLNVIGRLILMAQPEYIRDAGEIHSVRNRIRGRKHGAE